MQDLRTQDLADHDVKIHLSCKNTFLSLSLGFYLKGHLSTINEADFIITDSQQMKEKYTHLPICVIGSDLCIPCSVYEMFSQLHEFYSKVNAKQAIIFQQDMQNIQQSKIRIANLQRIKNTNLSYDSKKYTKQTQMIEQIKQQKMQEVMQNVDPALGKQIESLFNELSQKIYDSINKKK